MQDNNDIPCTAVVFVKWQKRFGALNTGMDISSTALAVTVLSSSYSNVPHVAGISPKRQCRPVGDIDVLQLTVMHCK